MHGEHKNETTPPHPNKPAPERINSSLKRASMSIGQKTTSGEQAIKKPWIFNLHMPLLKLPRIHTDLLESITKSNE
jgi:hypothetical protein